MTPELAHVGENILLCKAEKDVGSKKYNVSSLEIISEPLKSNGLISSLHEKKKIITMKIIKPLINLYKIK